MKAMTLLPLVSVLWDAHIVGLLRRLHRGAKHVCHWFDNPPLRIDHLDRVCFPVREEKSGHAMPTDKAWL
jgi:hypothetical protein